MSYSWRSDRARRDRSPREGRGRGNGRGEASAAGTCTDEPALPSARCLRINRRVLLAVSAQSATLIAALIAAGAALFKIVADAFAARSAEARAAHRQVLAPHLGDIGVAVHEVVSGAVLLYRRAQQGQAPGNAGVQAARGAETLKLKRLQVKYPLAGLEEPLRTLSRGYDWASTYQGDPSGEAFIEGLRALSRSVDATVSRSYARGIPPSWWERRRLNKQVKAVRAAWQARFNREPPEVADDAV
jgi:hypothetical protein